MSLTVVITPFTVTVATAVFEDDQLKFPLPPDAFIRVWVRKKKKKKVIMCTRMTLVIFDLFRLGAKMIKTSMKGSNY